MVNVTSREDETALLCIPKHQVDMYSTDAEWETNFFYLLLEMVRYAGLPAAVCGDNTKMPTEFAKLYSEMVSAKVAFPRERRFLDWPVNNSQSGLMGSAALDSDGENDDESVSHSGISRNPPRQINQNNSPVNPDRPAAAVSQLMNGGDLQQFGDLPTRLRDLKAARTKVGELVLANPGHPGRTGFTQDWQGKLRTTRDY